MSLEEFANKLSVCPYIVTEFKADVTIVHRFRSGKEALEFATLRGLKLVTINTNKINYEAIWERQSDEGPCMSLGSVRDVFYL